MAIAGILPVSVRRTYRPGDYNQRAFGVGMTLPYSMTLSSINQYQVVDLIQEDGSFVHYTRIIDPNNPSDNGYPSAHFVTNTKGPFHQSHIVWNGNAWQLTRTDGMLYIFPMFAPVESIQDRFGNKISIVRANGTTGSITQVSSSSGRSVRFSYDSGNRITQAVDNIGRTVSYTYDSSGRLTTVTDPDGGVATYTWDSSNRVQSIKDARGVTFITNTYDTNDRVTKQVLADGSIYSFVYTLNAGGQVVETDVTDPRGYVRKLTFNASMYVLTDKKATSTPQESDWSYTRDPTSNLVLSQTDPLGRVTTKTYDINGNVLSVTKLAGTANAVTTSLTYTPLFNRIATFTDPLGHGITKQWDALERITSYSDGLGHTRNFTYNSQGQIVTAADALGNTTQYAYGPDNDLVSITDPLGRVRTVYTDAIGRTVVATDPLGGRTQWTRDPINGVRQVADANGAATTIAYTPIGSVASVTDGRGGKTAFTYDSFNRLAARTDAVNAVAGVTKRDGVGNVLTASDRKSQLVTTTYDPLSRPTSATFADNSTLAWTWDLGGRLTQLQDSVGGTITRTYDGLDRLLTEATAQGTVTYTYDNAGRMLTQQAGSQAQATMAYDNADRLTGITQGSSSVALAYDAADRRTSATLPGGITATYAYDIASELTGITYASGSTTLGTLTYAYDGAGHVASRGGTLFQSVLPGAVASATYDLANRLTARTAAGVTASPTWDADGNLTNDGTNTYTWDARNRLLTVGNAASFVYDGSGRRTTATRNGTATTFLYSGWEVAQEQQGGSPSADLILGPGYDQRFARAGSTYLVDDLGSTLALAASGAVKTNYGYDPYGVTNTTGTASTNTFQFTGRENDGTGLLNYRARYYNPAWGRFISEDPIGLNGGVNFYAYANADPTDLKDPSGLFPVDPRLRTGASPGTRPTAQPGSGPSAPDGSPIDPAKLPTLKECFIAIMCYVTGSDPPALPPQPPPPPIQQTQDPKK